MRDRVQSSFGYAGLTVCLCLTALVGMWLPWVTRKVVYMSGEPTVSQVGYWGDQWGFGTGDGFILLITTLAIFAALFLRNRKRVRDLLVFLSGATLFLVVGDSLYSYWKTDDVLLEPAIFFVVLSGLLLCVLSIGAFLRRVAFRTQRGNV